MSTDTTSEFAVGEKVTIPAIEMPGQVNRIVMSRNGTFYDVSYWWEGRYIEVVLPPEELRKA